MKCVICNENIETIILDKINGTYIKKKIVCSNCQSKYKDNILDKIN